MNSLLKKGWYYLPKIITKEEAKSDRRKIGFKSKQRHTFIHKPLTLKFCRDYIYKHYNGFSRPRLEADDVLGILGTSNTIKGN